MKNGYDIKTFDSAEPYRIQMTQIKKFNLHWHSYIEIFYVKKGRIRLQTGEFSFHLDEGHICFVNANTIHSVNQTDLENQIMILQIPTDSGRPFFALHNYKFNSATYLSDFSKDAAPLDELRTLLENIYKENELKAAGYNQIILGYINTLLGLMIRRFYLIQKTDDDFTAEKNLSRLSDIITYLDDHYTEKLTLQLLADRLHINYYYLSHFFKNTAGISFQDYLNNLRVDKSLPLLAEADNNITDIALDSGFPNIKAYTKAFREKFGMLPSVYRKVISSDLNPDSLNEEKLIHLYSGQTNTASSNASPLDLYKKMNLTPKENRIFSLDYYVSNSSSPQELVMPSSIEIEKDAFINTTPYDLTRICTELSINELSIVSSSFTDDEKILLTQKSGLLGVKNTSFAFSEASRCTEDPYTDSISMIGAALLINDFLQKSDIVPTCQIKLLKNHITDSPLFFLSNSYQTSFGCLTPLFYVNRFLHLLRGSLVFHADGCAIYRNGESYQILCYHKKSLQMYQSLTDSGDFFMDNYLFFVNSFPHMQYTFSFNAISKRMHQTTYILSENHGSVFSEWCRMGSPDKLNASLADYLISVTRPELSCSVLPFEEKPIVSVDLPPLGIAYIELTPK